jgi:hypothetical protein
MPGKRIQLDDETWNALDLLARDRMMTFQELTDEAFAALLKKHGRPVDLIGCSQAQCTCRNGTVTAPRRRRR